MPIQQLPQPEWRSFFERFSREHHGWLATVHGVEHARPVTRVALVAIRSVSLEEDVEGRDVRLTFGSGLSLCALRPTAVRVQKTTEDADSALEIDTSDGGFVRVAFRASARPEELDGVAPGELTDGMASLGWPSVIPDRRR